MAANPVFPAFIQLEHRRDGSAKSSFLAEVDSMVEPAEQRFRAFTSEAKRQLDAAMSATRNAGAGLNLDVPGLQAAARAQEQRAAAARELARATAIAAKEQGDYSQSTRLAIIATETQAREEAEAAAAARNHAAAVEQVQRVLNRQASASGQAFQATRAATAANDNLTTSIGAQRAGMQQLSFQIGDVAQQFALGVRPQVIFAQQSGQVLQAVQLMTGGTSRLAGFLAGPWGIAITAATVALSPFVAKLFESEQASKQAEFASYAFGDAQSILGSVLDLTTGKIKEQSVALIALARAQLAAGQIQAQREQAEARSEMRGIRKGSIELQGGFGGGLNVVRTGDASADIVSAFQSGSLSLKEAERGLRSLMDTGLITEDAYLRAAEAVTKFGVAAENLKVFESAGRALDGDAGALQQFLQPGRSRKPRKPRAAKADNTIEFGEDAAKKIANVRDAFADIPPEVAKANRATRELDDIISDLERRQPENFRAMIADAQELKAIIPKSGSTRR